MTPAAALSIHRAVALEVGLSVEAVTREVARASRIPLAMLVGRSRRARIVRARHLAMRKAHECGSSVLDIASYFDRDASTVSYAINKRSPSDAAHAGPLDAGRARRPTTPTDSGNPVVAR